LVLTPMEDQPELNALATTKASASKISSSRFLRA
jgi:hypothetical protein